MAKIIRVTGYLVVHDNVSEREVEEIASDCLGGKFDGIPKHFSAESVSLGENLFWSEAWQNHPLNRVDCPITECEKYFVKRKEKIW